MKILAVALSLLSFSTFADFNKSVSGTGAVSSNVGMSLVCENIHFDLAQTATTLTIKGIVKCGDQFDIEYDESVFSIINGRLILDSKDVGSISANEIRMKFQTTDDNGQPMDAVTNFTNKGKLVQFEQGMTTPQYQITIKGDLK